jgi:hypothetical protein
LVSRRISGPVAQAAIATAAVATSAVRSCAKTERM